MSNMSILLLVFGTIFAPFFIGKFLSLFPAKSKQEPQDRFQQIIFEPLPFVDEDDLLDNYEQYAEPPVQETVNEKERKAEFYRQQALLDADFLISQVDDMYREIRDIDEQINAAEEDINGCEARRDYENQKAKIKERDRLMKRRRTLAGQIHGTEKKLRNAQFKAGQRVAC